MKKPMRVMNDPALDRIFTEAYTETMQRVEVRERSKQAKDQIDAFARFFEEELLARDLSSGERQEFLQAFRTYIATADKRRTEALQIRRKKILITIGSAVGAAALAFGIFVWTTRPFTPLSEIEADLNEYLSKVDEGYGAYANRYYRLLDTYTRKLGSARVNSYEDVMYHELDEQFAGLIQRLENGEITYLDDARKWAKYFPESEERDARREMANNAFTQGLGRTVGDSLNNLKEGAKGLIDRAAEIIEEKKQENTP